MSHLPGETDLTRRGRLGSLHDELIDYWDLSEESGAREDHHFKHQFTDNNTVLTAGGPDVGSGAGLFVPANSEYLSVADHADFELTGNFTFCVSLFTPTLPVSSGDQYSIFGQYDAGANQRSYLLQLYNNGGTQEVRFLTTTLGSGTFVNAAWVTTLATSTWHRFVCDYDGSNIHLYHNDVTEATTARTTAIHNSTAELQVGANPNSGTAENFYDGRIARVGLWSRVLVAEERTHLDSVLKGAAAA